MVSEDEDRSKPFMTLSAGRACDSCKTSSAHLFCRADSAFLCAGCDAKVHGANKLASRHERVWMCEVCEQAPASFTCKADAAALCVTCDRDIHSANPLASRHERLPVVPFYHSPAAAFVKSNGVSLLDDEDDDDDDAVPVPNDTCQDDPDRDADPASWLFCTPNTKLTDGQDLKSGCDYFFSDVDPYLDLDYASAMDGRFHQHNGTGADSVVPVQYKPFNSPVLNPSPDNGADQDFCRPKASYGSYTTAPSLSQSVSSSSMDVGVVPDGTDISTPFGASLKNGAEAAAAGAGGNGNPAAAAAAQQQLLGLDREARVMRYREKRKNRKFEKTIRYASRKAYAETRPRIKGRFAKRAEIEAEVDRIYSTGAGAALIADTAYGVVPTLL